MTVATSPNQTPLAGEPRRRWLRHRLVALVQSEMVVCPVRLGVHALTFLALFETVTGEAFTDTPGALVGSRLRGLAKVLGNVAREGQWDPPLQQLKVQRGRLWSRCPREPIDAEAWRRTAEESEAFAAPVPRLRQQMGAADEGLAAWVKGHPYLMPAEVDQGESGIALLILWEVDHKRVYPSQGGEGLSGAVTGFTKWLQERVQRDQDWSTWLT